MSKAAKIEHISEEPSPSAWQRISGVVSSTRDFVLEYGRPAVKYAWIPLLMVVGMTEAVEGPAWNYVTHFQNGMQPQH